MTTFNEIFQFHYAQKRKGKRAKRSQFYQWNKNWKKAKREGLEMMYSTVRPYYRVVKNHGWDTNVIQEIKSGESKHVGVINSIGSFDLELHSD